MKAPASTRGSPAESTMAGAITEAGAVSEDTASDGVTDAEDVTVSLWW